MPPAVRERGDGPAIVLAHGSMMDHGMFSPQVEALSSQFRVLSYDHRARTERWKGPYDLYDLAEDCKEILDELGIAKCVLGGMSMGGCMALRFALRYDERLHGLVLIGAFASPYSDEEQRRWENHYARIRGFDRLPEWFVEGEAQLCFGRTTRQQNPGLVKSWKQKWAAFSGETVYFETLSWIKQDDIRAQLSGIRVPALVIHGNDDEAVAIDEAEFLCRALPEATLIRVPAAGHTVNLEQPDPVNRAIREFVRRLHGGGALRGGSRGDSGEIRSEIRQGPGSARSRRVEWSESSRL